MASCEIMDTDARIGPALLRLLSRFLPEVRPVPAPEQDEARARRDFLMEMLDRNPDAFASEHDVQAMMRTFPGQF